MKEIIEELKEEIDINFEEESERKTYLHIACERNYLDIVKYLLTNPKIEVNKLDKEGVTPLYLACEKGNFEIVKLLHNLEEVDVNLPREQTPFYVACQNGHLEIIKLLLTNPQVKYNEPNLDFETPFFAACENGQLEVVKLLIQEPKIDIVKSNMKDITPFTISCQDLNMAKIFLRSSRYFNPPNSDNLLDLVTNGNLEMIQWLFSSLNEENAFSRNRLREVLLTVDKAQFQERNETETSRDHQKKIQNLKVIKNIIRQYIDDPIETKRKLRIKLEITSKFSFFFFCS